MDKIKRMEETTVNENINASNGSIRSEVSRDKECVIVLSLSLEQGSVQDAVKHAFCGVCK